jgi:hypothetical protein
MNSTQQYTVRVDAHGQHVITRLDLCSTTADPQSSNKHHTAALTYQTACVATLPFQRALQAPETHLNSALGSRHCSYNVLQEPPHVDSCCTMLLTPDCNITQNNKSQALNHPPSFLSLSLHKHAVAVPGKPSLMTT